MLTPDQEKRVLSVLDIDVDDDDDGWYQHTKTRVRDCSPAELHIIAAEWNWDNGWEALQAVAEHPNCDAATASLIFWGGRPDHILDDWMMAADSEELDVEHRDLLLDIQDRYGRGAYQKTGISFDPASRIQECTHSNVMPCMREKLYGLDLASDIARIRKGLR
jgi:hypothetical protein